ncbi:MAG TPA: hypothetical protein VF510_01385 [Ktedonobacterales bacterium]
MVKEVDLDAALRQRGWPARRLLMAALVGVLVLVTISGVIVTVNPGVPAALGDMLHGTPTPTATIVPGGNIAYYENGAPWGKLTVDGRSMPIENTPRTVFLGRGRHTLIYRADPFPSLHCTISTPAAASDTCPLDATFTSHLTHPIGTRAVDLGSTLERLPAAQRDALITLVRSQVEYTSPVTTVRPGEHYAGVDGGKTALLERATQPPTRHLRASLPDSGGTYAPLETATQPLNATIQIRMVNAATAAGNGAAGVPTLDCAVLCMSGFSNNFPNMFAVGVHVKMGYHYTTQDGSIVLDYAPLHETQQTTWTPDNFLSLDIGWNGAWQDTRPPQDNATPPCQYGGGDLFPSAGVYPYKLTGTRPAPNPTDGCLFVARQISGDTVFGPPILFLHRFGVLLAVGDDAHQLLPNVTIASQREADEAYAIAAQGPLP